MIPTKPEDYEPAIPTDKKILKMEVKNMINGFNDMTDYDAYIQTKLLLNAEAADVVATEVVKCTCPIKLTLNKKKRKAIESGKLEVIHNVKNGYVIYCPVHSK